MSCWVDDYAVYLGAKRRYINTLPFLSFFSYFLQQSVCAVFVKMCDLDILQKFLLVCDGLLM